MSDSPDRKAKSLTQERFGRFAAGYVSSQSFAAAPELELLVEMAAPKSSWMVLDVATGGGHTALVFQPLVRQVVASDLTLRMLESARRYAQEVLAERQQRDDKGANIGFQQADAEALPYAEGTFDLVTCRIAPHHFPNAVLFVQESARILRPGGKLLVQDHLNADDQQAGEYLNAFERLRDPSHQRSFTRSEWEGMFQQAGLSVERVETVVKTHPFLPFVERQGCTLEVIAELAEMMREAPAEVRAWRSPEGFDGDLKSAVFRDFHIAIIGKKG